MGDSLSHLDDLLVHTYPEIFESATTNTALVHTHTANSQANPEIFESALQSGNF